MRSEKRRKILEQYVIVSRREIERWIKQGRVTQISVIAKLCERDESDDETKVNNDGVDHNLKKARRVLAYNKPEGEVCTCTYITLRFVIYQYSTGFFKIMINNIIINLNFFF